MLTFYEMSEEEKSKLDSVELWERQSKVFALLALGQIFHR